METRFLSFERDGHLFSAVQKAKHFFNLIFAPLREIKGYLGKES